MTGSRKQNRDRLLPVPSTGNLAAASSVNLAMQPLMSNCYSEVFPTECSNETTAHATSKISWIVAAVFIVADMVGGGVVAMPVAFKLSGLIPGSAIILVIAMAFQYTGYQLGRVWCRLIRRNPHIGVCRKPFPEMAHRTMGVYMGHFTSVLGNFTLFGIAIVYLLLASNIMHYFVTHVFQINNFSNCVAIMILAVAITPFTYLRSPAEFWGVIVIAMGTTVVAVSSILIGISLDAPMCFPHVGYPEFNAENAVFSVGTFLFAFSGHYVFPTIQHDMKDPEEFTKSVSLGFFVVTLLYMPLSIMSYVVYGSSMYESVIYSIQNTKLQLAANLMIAVHCIMTLVIVINPLNQEIEHHIKISHSFGPGRVVVRSLVMMAVTLVALSFPDFGPVMNLVGASTIPLGCVVLPVLFYLWSEAATEGEWRKGTIPSIKQVITRTDKKVLLLNIALLLLAIGGGGLATYLGTEKLLKSTFGAPCYLRPFLQGNYSSSFTIKNHCCGAMENVSVYNLTNFCIKH